MAHGGRQLTGVKEPGTHDQHTLEVAQRIDALIHDGDIVVLQSTPTAHNGEMVTAWIMDREETTLKRFYQENGRVRLQPENSTMDPIYTTPDNVEIQGKFVASFRGALA